MGEDYYLTYARGIAGGMRDRDRERLYDQVVVPAAQLTDPDMIMFEFIVLSQLLRWGGSPYTAKIQEAIRCRLDALSDRFFSLPR